MKIAQTKAIGMIGVALLVGTAAVGCGGDDKESSTSSSSSTSTSAAATTSAAASETTSASASPAASGTDYTNLLIKPTDIDPSVITPNPPVLNPNGVKGVGQSYTNAGGKETIFITVVVLDDPAAAVAGVQAAKDSIAKEVTGQPQPADVGDGGFLAAGTSPDGSKAVTEVYFSQGKAQVNLEFESAPNDPIQPDSALAIAKMQATQVKNNLT